MRYHWDSTTLRNDLKTLKKWLAHEKDPLVRERIIFYIQDVKNTIINEEKYLPPHLNKEELLADLCKEVPQFAMYDQIVQEAYKKLTIAEKEGSLWDESQKIIPLRCKILSDNDFVELTHEFFRSISKEVYELYDKLYQRRFEHYRFQEADDSRMIFLPGVNKSYVEIDTSSDYRNILLSTIHEEGHCLASLMNPNRYFEENAFFREIESHFFELLAMPFFEKELQDEGFRKAGIDTLESYMYFLEEILDSKRLAEECDHQHYPLSKDLILKDENLMATLQDVLNGQCSSVEDSMKYTISYLVAVELFEQYQTDKDEALEKWKRIMNQNKEDSEYENLMENVTPNRSLIKYRKRITSQSPKM